MVNVIIPKLWVAFHYEPQAPMTERVDNAVYCGGSCTFDEEKVNAKAEDAAYSR